MGLWAGVLPDRPQPHCWAYPGGVPSLHTQPPIPVEEGKPTIKVGSRSPSTCTWLPKVKEKGWKGAGVGSLLGELVQMWREPQCTPLPKAQLVEKVVEAMFLG